MMAYASRTGTKRNIKALKEAGWGWMVTPVDMGGAIREGMPYALDNGAWSAFCQQSEWDEGAFITALERYGEGADFIVVPDVVGNAEATLKLAPVWVSRLVSMPKLKGYLLIAGQDGMQLDDLAPLLAMSPRVGVFIGGSSEWKERVIIPWGRSLNGRGVYVHVGRVNTARRIHLCGHGMVNSFDGTSVTRFAKTLPMLDEARKQMGLL